VKSYEAIEIATITLSRLDWWEIFLPCRCSDKKFLFKTNVRYCNIEVSLGLTREK